MGGERYKAAAPLATFSTMFVVSWPACRCQETLCHPKQHDNVPFKELRPCAGMGAADVAAHGAVELFIETAEPM